MKKTIQLFLFASLLLLGSATAWAQTSGSCGDNGNNVTWSLSSGTLTISGTGGMANYATNGSAPWYSSRSSVTQIVINSGVTSISVHAFYNLTNATSVTIPSTVTNIGYGFVMKCTNLTSISVDNNNTKYTSKDSNGNQCNAVIAKADGKTLYAGCKNTTIPSTVQGINIEAFAGMDVSNITLPSSVATIGSSAFANSQATGTFVIPASVTAIRTDAFSQHSINAIDYQSNVLPDNTNVFGLLSGTSSTIIVHSAKIGYYFRQNYFSPSEEFPTGYNVFTPTGWVGQGNVGMQTSEDRTTYWMMDTGNHLYVGGEGAMPSTSISNLSLVKSVTIEQGISRIGANTFDSCTSLEEVIFENGSSSLALDCSHYGSGNDPYYSLFHNCPLKTVYLGRDLQIFDMGNNQVLSPFKGTSVQNVTIGTSVTQLPRELFVNCQSLSSVTFNTPSSLYLIGQSAFANCSALSTFKLDTGYSQMPDCVTSMGEAAFRGCSNLYFLGLSENLQSIPKNAFYGCSALDYMSIPASVRYVYTGSFTGCTSLKNLSIVNGSTPLTLYNYDEAPYSTKSVFYDCPKESVHIGRNIAYANEIPGRLAFAQSNVKSVSIGPDVTTLEAGCFQECQWLETVNLTNATSLTSIDSYVFSKCNSLESITIPNAVTAIGSHAFSDCENLESIQLPNGLTSISNGLFYDCYDLRSLTIPSQVATIGANAFENCTRLSSLTIPASVTSIGNEAFNGCNNLTTLTFADGSETLNLGYKKYLTMYDSGSYGLGLFYDCPLQTVYLGRNITYSTSELAGLSPFCRMISASYPSSLKSVTVGNQVTTLPENLFRSCVNLTSVSIPASVQSIDMSAFGGCSALVDITGSSLEHWLSIKGLANLTICNNKTHHLRFGSPSGDVVKSIVIPDETTTIPEAAFYHFDINTVTLPTSVTSIAIRSFDGCPLTTVNVATLDNWCDIDGIGRLNAFSTGKQLVVDGTPVTAVTVPNGVSTIPESAFYGYAGIESISLPNTVTKVENVAFYQMPDLNHVTCLAQTPPALEPHGTGYWYFIEDAKAAQTQLTVPNVSMEAYGEATGWSKFSPITGVDALTIDVSAMNVEADDVIDLASHVTCPEGYEIVSWTSSNPDKVAVDANGVVTILPAAKYNGQGTFEPVEATITATERYGTTLHCDFTVATEAALADGTVYSNPTDTEFETVTYTRNFANTTWQAWYAPFDLVLTDDLMAEYEFARLEGILLDGEEWCIAALKLQSGETVKACVPYLVKVKADGEHVITLEDATLYKAASTSFTISSASDNFTFTGIFEPKTSSESDLGWYGVAGEGGFSQALISGLTLNGYRFYLTVEERTDNPYAVNHAAGSNLIRIREIGDATMLENVVEEIPMDAIFDIRGNKVESPTESGVYIINGKKVYIK